MTQTIGTHPLRSHDVVELPLLLPGWQAAALEAAAHRRGITVGQVMRQLLEDGLAREQTSRSPSP